MSQKLKVILLNPPSQQVVIRDYYCSKSSKTSYIVPPLDLLFFSGYLKDDFDLELIDAIVNRYSVRQTQAMVEQVNPDAIIFIIGAVSWQEDMAFMEKVAEGRIILGSGDLFLQDAERWLNDFPFIDGILENFSTADCRSFLLSEFEKISYMTYRYKGEIVKTNKSLTKDFSLPLPRHDLFVNNPYQHSFSHGERFCSVLTDFGCPFKCRFCIMATLSYRTRPIVEVIEELVYIKKLGISEIFFLDQTFMAVKKRGMELCQKIIEADLKIGWTIFSRVDVLDSENLSLMKRAGCHTLILGVEMGNDALLKKYGKGYSKSQIRETFSLCHAIGLETVGTFILGLPEETQETCEETIDLAMELDCDYVSYNIAVPRIGTELREVAIANDLIEQDFLCMDQSSVNMPTLNLSKNELALMISRALRRFYLRPSYLLKRLRRLRNLRDFRHQILEGYYLLKNLLKL